MITIIGAANVDITASPLGRYVPCDSNPSRVEISYGGVGRNIAHNLCLMGEQVRLFTVFGDDSIALSLRDDCTRPLYIDATSAAKSMKIRSLLGIGRQAPLIVRHRPPGTAHCEGQSCRSRCA